MQINDLLSTVQWLIQVSVAFSLSGGFLIFVCVCVLLCACASVREAFRLKL